MVSGINSLSAGSIPLLFGTSNSAAIDSASNAAKLFTNATGNTDDVLRTGDAIGNIIALALQQDKKDTLFQMVQAERVYTSDGDYSETSTGTATVGADANDLSGMQEAALGTGAEADRAKAYLDAVAKGTVQKYDMSDMGVSSTMTSTKLYYADGGNKGEKVTFNTTGMRQFLEANTEIDADGILRDKATGKYAGIEQNGTKFTYLTY